MRPSVGLVLTHGQPVTKQLLMSLVSAEIKHFNNCLDNCAKSSWINSVMYFLFQLPNIDSNFPSPAYINHYDLGNLWDNHFPVFPFPTWTSVTLILALFSLCLNDNPFPSVKGIFITVSFSLLFTNYSYSTCKILVMNTSYSEIEHLVCVSFPEF